MKKLLVAYMIFLMSSLSVTPLTKEIIPLWNNDNPTTDNENVPTLTVYHPDIPNGVAAIMCPGGGYGHLALEHEGHDMAEWFANQGITYAVLKYRLPQGNKDIPLVDAEQAMRIVRSHCKEWHINPHRVGIMGGSAGGHLAATLSTMYSCNDVRPDFQVLFYPVISMEEGITNDGTRNNLLGLHPSQELIELYSLENRVSSSTPRAFILLSADDGVSPENSIRYFQALSRHKVPSALHIYPTGGHGWGFKDSFEYKDQWTAELKKWFQSELINKSDEK